MMFLSKVLVECPEENEQKEFFNILLTERQQESSTEFEKYIID